MPCGVMVNERASDGIYIKYISSEALSFDTAECDSSGG